jgi:hypothetical protein
MKDFVNISDKELLELEGMLENEIAMLDNFQASKKVTL